MWEQYDLQKWRKSHGTPKPRSFALMLSVVFLYLGAVTFKINPFFMTLALLCLVIGVLRPQLFSLPSRWWQDLGFTLGWLMTPVILTLVYFLFFVPMALIMKLCGHRALPYRGWVDKVRQCRFERIF